VLSAVAGRGMPEALAAVMREIERAIDKVEAEDETPKRPWSPI